MTSESLETIRHFIATAQAPVLVEPGEEPLPLAEGSYQLEDSPERPAIAAWTESRTLNRRITGILSAKPGRIEIATERFAKKPGTLVLFDQNLASQIHLTRRATRMVLREQLRVWLGRQFPGWRIADLTSETDMEHSLSPVYPRAMVRHGGSAWAAVAAPNDTVAADGLLTAGLIWLDYLRRRETRIAVEGLAMFLTSGREALTCMRLRYLHPRAAQWRVFVYDEWGRERMIEHPESHGNIDTRVDPAGTKSAAAVDPQLPEAILERNVRREITVADPSLLAAPIYGQVPALAATDRGIMDLLAVDRSGRLAVLEIKATAEPRLPVQALDYWMRVAWHQSQGDFARNGYFPGVPLRPDPPRLLLVAPALEFHPATETVLRFYSSGIDVERIGLAVQWQERVQVMFRLRGSQTPY